MKSSGMGLRAGAITAILGRWLRLGCLLACGFSTAADTALNGTNVWRFRFTPFAEQQNTLCSPAVAPDGTIYIGTFSGRFQAISPTGKEQWRFKAGREIKSSPAVGDDGTIYFGCRDRQLYALTPDGHLKWKFRVGGWVDSSPALAADGTVYFGSWDRTFYALKPDGSLKWKYVVGGVVDSSPAIAADGTVYFGAHDRKFYALSPVGNLRWTFQTGAEITSSPAIGSDGHLYFGSMDGCLYRLKPDGTEVWHCRTGSGGDGSPVLAENGNVVIAAPYKTQIISPAGAVVWTWGSPDWVDSTPAVAGEVVFLSAPWHRLWGLAEDGSKVFWEVQLDASLSSSPVIGNHGEIYCCTDRCVEALQPPPLLLSPLKSSWPMFRADARHTGRVRNPDAAR